MRGAPGAESCAKEDGMGESYLRDGGDVKAQGGVEGRYCIRDAG